MKVSFTRTKQKVERSCRVLPNGAIAQSSGDNIDRDPLWNRRKLQTVDHMLTGHVTNEPAIHSPEFHDASIFNGAFLNDVIHRNTEEKNVQCCC